MSDWQEERGRRDRARREEVMRLPVLRARRHGAIDGQDDDVLVCASVGPVGELVVVWTAPEGLEAVSSTTVSAAGASFPDAAAARPVAARIKPGENRTIPYAPTGSWLSARPQP